MVRLGDGIPSKDRNAGINLCVKRMKERKKYLSLAGGLRLGDCFSFY